MHYAIRLRYPGAPLWLHPAVGIGTIPSWKPQQEGCWEFTSRDRAEGECRYWGGALALVVEV